MVARAAMRIAGLRERYTRETMDEVPALWARFMRHMGKVPGQLGLAAYGVCYNIDREGGFDYMSGVEVADNARLPAPLAPLTIAEQTYALFTHRGHVSTLARTWGEIHGHGLFDAGLRPIDAPAFERYDGRFDPGTGEGTVEIWVPVAR